ncbi:tyrosine-type recombinase/integrase [Serratia marcescens]|nr:tyrosine-type recombinase/integrase [Serratia marcescens]MBH2817544.1 tyrosine-type recombinase/integrase [Serratia marcescens]
MAIKGNQYLYQNRDGIWIFQVFVPTYMRAICEGKRAFRKSTGTRDLVQARDFRDHMIIEFNKIKNQLKPDTPEIRVQRGIAALHYLTGTQPKRAAISLPTPLISADNPQLEHAPLTLATVRDEYLSEYQDKRKLTTLSKTLLSVNIFIESLGVADIAISDIKRTQVTAFIREQKQDKSSQTVQNYLSSLSAVYEYARRCYDGIPTDCPFKRHALEAKSAVESYEPFDIEDTKTLLNAADDELRDVILIGLYQGMRLDEICSLRCVDVIRDGGGLSLHISMSKTKAGIRTIPVHSLIVGVIEKYLSRGNEYLLPNANNVTRSDGKKSPYFSQKFTRLRNRVLPAASDRQCFHSLRGMFITCLDRHNIDDSRIAALVGHTQKTMAKQVYSQGAELEVLRKIIELVDYEGAING